MSGGFPHLISVQGLKNSGKTTVCEGLIASLLNRGFTVGSMKVSHQSRPIMDWQGSDTFRQARAGAEFIVAPFEEETVILDRRPGERSLSALIRLLPRELQLMICEGLTAPEVAWYVICLSRPQQLGETIKLRQVPEDRLAAISGPAAVGAAMLPRFDITEAEERETLTSLILEKLGNPPPAALPRGPLRQDPHWRPGD